MSDNTKKSIVINQSFLSSSGSSSGTGNYGSSGSQNKKSKKIKTRLTDESIIKPNKLKRMLLDKINAKRKAEQTSIPVENSTNDIKIDVSKESKIFSNEFKKSLEFLDNYVNTKHSDKNKNRTKTLKKQNAGSLTNDIIKTLHNNNRVKPMSQLNTVNNFVQTQIQKPHFTNTYMQSPSQVSPVVNSPANPLFQKIQLQLPSKPVIPIQNKVSTPQKINLALSKNLSGENLIYTELPPELQPTPPSTMMFMPSSSVPIQQPIATELVNVADPIAQGGMGGTGEMGEMGGMGEMGEMGEMKEINNDIIGIDSIQGKTSLATSTPTFSPIKLFDDKPYGCLKDGKKPTYRAYNKTIKNNLRFSDNEQNDNNNEDNQPETERQQKLRELKNRHRRKKTRNYDDNDDNDDNATGENDNKKYKSSKVSIRRHLRKTITKKFKLGKQGNTVGVLIKNNETRKNVQKEHGILKNKKLSDVKKYLVEHNLIKIGSTAPPAIIRKIYEDSVLTGEVENIGKGVSLHNFLEDEKSW